MPPRLRAVPIFPLEFVEPRKDIAKTGARNPGQGKTREARKIGTADNLLFKIKPVRQATQSCDWSVPEIAVNGFLFAAGPQRAAGQPGGEGGTSG